MMTSQFPIPLIAGDYPDPSVIRVGGDYYMTHSSFRYAPGLLIWHSTDFVHWVPVGHALSEYDGDVWAPDLVYHNGEFAIYYPTNGSTHVITAKRVEGPWSRPIDLHVGGIDPGHVVGPDGTRYLHLSGGYAVPLTQDGLAVQGTPAKVFEAWPIPSDWRIEGVCLESPKLVRRGDYYYLLVAQGGTAGPATSHMVVAARSRSPLGPWEYSPYNPVIRTCSRAERWWSRGHGTLIELANGEWVIVHHGYLAGFHTLGRQTLVTPIEWTPDGWFRALPETAANAAPASRPSLSDDFTGHALGWQWGCFDEADPTRYATGSGGLSIRAKGDSPADCAPLCCIPQDRAYSVEADLEIEDSEAVGGLFLFYNPKAYFGLMVKDGRIWQVNGDDRWPVADIGVSDDAASAPMRVSLKITNDRHEIDYASRLPKRDWLPAGGSTEASGYHHNVFGGFVSLRVALCAMGRGIVRVKRFVYNVLQDQDTVPSASISGTY
jgi:beta-xylosidase